MKRTPLMAAQRKRLADDLRACRRRDPTLTRTMYRRAMYERSRALMGMEHDSDVIDLVWPQ